MNLRHQLGELCLENVNEVSRISEVKYLTGSESKCLELGTGSIYIKIIRDDSWNCERQPHSQEE